MGFRMLRQTLSLQATHSLQSYQLPIFVQFKRSTGMIVFDELSFKSHHRLEINTLNGTQP